MAQEEEESLEQTIERVRSTVNSQIDSGVLDDIDNMSVKELKLKVFGETAKILSNNEKASIVSVVVYIAVT